MASYFDTYTCECNLAEQTIYCCTYGDEYSCPIKANWKFCPYCGQDMRPTFTQSSKSKDIPLPPSPPPEVENYSNDKADMLATSSVKPYVPPPRIKEAEQFWPFMVCKAIIRQLTYSYWPLPEINYRSHHALLSYLATRYKMTIDELVKTNPLDIIDDFNLRIALGSPWVNKPNNHYTYLQSVKAYKN
jgi:hypothetical protein